MSMIINISLFIIFFCMLFIILSKRIEVHPLAKGVMCIIMLCIIGIIAQSKHEFLQAVSNGFISSIATLVFYVTFKAYKRGSL